MIKPDYNHSILNLSATLSNFLGNKNKVNKLEKLNNFLNNEIKNIIFIIFDGLGVNNVNLLSKNNSFYKSHIVDEIYSTMPATTTNATTTLKSVKYPDEHLWLDWSLYLKKQKRVVEIYLSKDYHTGEKTKEYKRKVEFYLDKTKTDRKLTTIAPIYAYYSKKIERKIANTVEELFNQLNNTINNNEKHFVYCYCDEPDHTMHEKGIISSETQEKFDEIEFRLKNFIKNNKNTLIITTADHGHIDIKKYINIQQDNEIMSLQARPISMEPRFISFKIKDKKQNEFKEIFNKKYGKYFYLLSQKEVLNEHFFGKGKNTKKIKEFIGDFIAIGNDTFYAININNNPSPLKGNHAGATKEEMIVPLCVFENKNK